MARKTLLMLVLTLVVACGPLPPSSQESSASTEGTTPGTTAGGDPAQVCSGIQTVKDLVHEIAVAAPDLSDEAVAGASESEEAEVVEQANAAASFIEEVQPELRAAFQDAENAAPSLEIAAAIRKLGDMTQVIHQAFISILGGMKSLDDFRELEERYAEPTSFTIIVAAQGQAAEKVDAYVVANCGFSLAQSEPDSTTTTTALTDQQSTTTTIEVPMTRLPELLALGGSGNVVGNSCDPALAGCDGQPGYWANISGKWLPRALGDAYSAACLESLDRPGCADANDLHRESGYLYGVETNGQSSFSVEFNDIAFMNTSGGFDTGDFIRTGDRGCEDWEPSDSADCGPTMLLNLFAPGPDPLDLVDRTALCSVTVPPVAQVALEDPYSFASPASCFTVSDPEAGVYVVEVRIVDPGDASDRSGINRYSLRSSDGTRLFGLGNMSIYANASVGSDFLLAEVPEHFAGNTFTLEFFDVGEVRSGQMQIVDPSTGEVFDGNCHISTTSDHAQGWSNRLPYPTCEQTVDRALNGMWLRFQMELPTDYSCGADCWWRIRYDTAEPMVDSFTFEAYLEH